MVQYKTFGLKHYIVFVKKKACSQPNYFLTHHFLHHYFQNRDFSTVSTSSVSASIQQRDGYSNVLGEDGRGRAPTHRWNYFQLVLFASSCPPTSWPPPSMKKSLCLKSCLIWTKYSPQPHQLLPPDLHRVAEIENWDWFKFNIGGVQPEGWLWCNSNTESCRWEARERVSSRPCSWPTWSPPRSSPSPSLNFSSYSFVRQPAFSFVRSYLV